MLVCVYCKDRLGAFDIWYRQVSVLVELPADLHAYHGLATGVTRLSLASHLLDISELPVIDAVVRDHVWALLLLAHRVHYHVVALVVDINPMIFCNHLAMKIDFIA